MKPTLLIRRDQLNNFRTETFRELSGGLHFHAPIEMLWVKSGSVRVLIKDKWDIVNQGDLAIVQSYEAHQFLSAEAGEYVVFFFPLRLCPEFCEIIQRKRIYAHIIHEIGNLSIIDSLSKLEKGGLNVIEEMGHVNVVLGFWLRQTEPLEKEIANPSNLSLNLIRYINDHYLEDISIGSISEALGYNRHHLSKCFRESFNTGIGDYVNTLRLKNAVMLMRKKDKCITDCALESGFGSLRTFYRVFEEEFGCSPREYMRTL